ncbi:DUF305 domain-containing protein [Candidatus Gottesmanbacteria bacterium]|nr:DUF305 domain-containing protein [Candidatus Gottesmanbacteria bacterium]
MKNQAILYGIIGLLVGIVIMLLTAQNAVNTNNTGMMRMMGMRTSNAFQCPMQENNNQGMMGMNSSMSQMMESMKGKTDDEFDRAFIEAMIVHHQGAIDMAKQAQENAKHPEIQDLANDIISTQTNEIEIMSIWKNQWGY